MLLALEVFAIGDSGAGLLSAALGLGMIAGGAATFSLVGRQRLAPVLAVAAVVWGVCLALVGAVPSVWVAMPLIVVGGIGYAACDVVGRTILQRVTPDRMLARVLGTLEGIGLVGLALGAAVRRSSSRSSGSKRPSSWSAPPAARCRPGLVGPACHGSHDTGAHEGARAATRRSAARASCAPQLETVARRTRWMTVEQGDVLIREGDPGDAYYVLESGEMAISQAGRHLRNTTDRGEGFGEIALLLDVPRTATVTAVRSSVLLMLGRADFLEAVTGHPQAHDAAARRLAAERSGAGPG